MAGSSDSIEFLANYNGWVERQGIEIRETTKPVEVASELAVIREAIDRKAFEVLGIDLKSLDAFAGRFADSFPKNDYKALAGIYKSLGSAEAEIIKAAQNRDELKPFAKVYLLRATVKKLGLDWYVASNNKALEGKARAQKAGTVPSEGIAFMAKYKEWVSIKKLSVDEKTKPEEVAAHLSSIRMATDRKLPQILGINTENLDIYASTATNNMRKSVANIEKVTDILCSPETKAQIDAAIQSESVRSIAVIYLFSVMLQNIKVDLEVSPNTLMDMFPGLKIPKPKGRMPGQKKKK